MLVSIAMTSLLSNASRSGRNFLSADASTSRGTETWVAPTACIAPKSSGKFSHMDLMRAKAWAGTARCVGDIHDKSIVGVVVASESTNGVEELIFGLVSNFRCELQILNLM